MIGLMPGVRCRQASAAEFILCQFVGYGARTTQVKVRPRQELSQPGSIERKIRRAGQSRESLCPFQEAKELSNDFGTASARILREIRKPRPLVEGRCIPR